MVFIDVENTLVFIDACRTCAQTQCVFTYFEDQRGGAARGEVCMFFVPWLGVVPPACGGGASQPAVKRRFTAVLLTLRCAVRHDASAVSRNTPCILIIIIFFFTIIIIIFFFTVIMMMMMIIIIITCSLPSAGSPFQSAIRVLCWDNLIFIFLILSKIDTGGMEE